MRKRYVLYTMTAVISAMFFNRPVTADGPAETPRADESCPPNESGIPVSRDLHPQEDLQRQRTAWALDEIAKAS